MIAEDACIVCESALLEFGAPGDLRQYDCSQCGKFDISRTACAMLRSRLAEDPKVRRRLSHAIRRRAEQEPWFSIDSGNLDALIAERLPDYQRQRANLLAWLAARLRDSEGEPVTADYPSLVGLIGTANAEVIRQHILELAAEGLLLREETRMPTSIIRWSLTNPGWGAADRSQSSEGPTLEDYDLFISHASDDKAGFVDALVSELHALEIRVWYDATVLRLGDSLRRSIDKGLARSRFGVVVLSPAFFAKECVARPTAGCTCTADFGEDRCADRATRPRSSRLCADRRKTGRYVAWPCGSIPLPIENRGDSRRIRAPNGYKQGCGCAALRSKWHKWSVMG